MITNYTVFTNINTVFKAKLISYFLFSTFTQAHRRDFTTLQQAGHVYKRTTEVSNPSWPGLLSYHINSALSVYDMTQREVCEHLDVK